MIYNLVVSFVRTGVPAGVAWVVGWLVARGVEVPAETRDWAVGGIGFGILMAYYLIARSLETQWPALGVLLGVPQKPIYAKQLPDGSHVITNAPANTTIAPAAAAPEYDLSSVTVATPDGPKPEDREVK